MAGPTTVHNGAKTVAPAINAALATIASGSLPKGKYLITIEAALSAVTEVGNVEYREGASVILPGLANTGGQRLELIRELDGATAISLNATAAGTAGAIYGCSLVAKRLT